MENSKLQGFVQEQSISVQNDANNFSAVTSMDQKSQRFLKKLSMQMQKQPVLHENFKAPMPMSP